MRCQRCERVNRPDAVFCDACGVTLDAATVDATAPVGTVAAGGPETASVLPASHDIRTSGHDVDKTFVGRQPEMGTLQAALEDALAGRGRLLMLVGAAGIGKTRMAREFCRHTERRGTFVLWGRCHESSGAPPYWPWVQIIRTYQQHRSAEQLRGEMGAEAADIAALVAEVGEQLPDLPAPPRFEDPEQARFRLFDSLTRFLLRVSRSFPLLLVLDNLHWADKPSLLLLEFLAQELDDSRILVLGTYRDVDVSRQHPLSETLGELGRERPLQRILLHGLSRQDVGQFMTMTTGHTPSPALLEAVHSQTEGNPLFLTEMVRLLVQEGSREPQMVLPEGVRDVIGKRLNRLSQPCNELLTIAAVIGREFVLQELVGLLAPDAEEHVLGLLEEAMMARVIEEMPQTVGRFQFTHALIRATLYDELTMVRRMQLHQRIGKAIEALYGTNLEPHLAQLAYHFGEAAQSGEVEPAIDYAMRAGKRAENLLAYEEAVRHYEMALQAMQRQQPMDDAQRCQILLAMGEVQRKAGDVPHALDTFQQAADLARVLGCNDGFARAALGFEETSWRPGLPGDAAARLLEDALLVLGDGDSLLKARTLGSLARALLFTGSLDQAMTLEEEAVTMARRLADPATLAAALKARFYAARWRPQYIHTSLATATELIKLADQLGDRELALQAHAWRLFDLMDCGDIAAVHQQIEIHMRLAEALRQPFDLYIGVTSKAMCAIFAGQFETAEALAQQALRIGQRLPGQDAMGVFGVQMFTLRREQGRLQELAPIVRHFVQTAPETSTWRPGLALIYSELGLEREARMAFERLAAHDFADLPYDAVWLTCITYLTEVCAFLGDARRAAILYSHLIPYDGFNITIGPTAACYGAASRFLGILASTMADWDVAQNHFEAALAMNSRMGAKPWMAHTQHAYAGMLLARHRSGDREQALNLLDEALAISQALGMRALEQRVLDLCEQVRPQVSQTQLYPCGLSQREVDVLRLIAAGKSNRDIAASLFISPHTVANHVRNILSKTGTANRTEATALAIQYGLLEA